MLTSQQMESGLQLEVQATNCCWLKRLERLIFIWVVSSLIGPLKGCERSHIWAPGVRALNARLHFILQVMLEPLNVGGSNRISQL